MDERDPLQSESASTISLDTDLMDVREDYSFLLSPMSILACRQIPWTKIFCCRAFILEALALWAYIKGATRAGAKTRLIDAGPFKRLKCCYCQHVRRSSDFHTLIKIPPARVLSTLCLSGSRKTHP